MLFAAVAFLGTAPYQCKSDDPARAREDSPADALFDLCARFAAQGDDASARATLDYLIQRYPSSRLVARAKDEREAAHPCADVVPSGSGSGSASVKARPPASAASSSDK